MPLLIRSSCLTVFMLFFCASSALAHSLWLETVEASPKAGRQLELNVGFNEGFEIADIPEQSVSSISTPVMTGKNGETKFALKGGPNYAYVSEKAVPAGSYLLTGEYKPFIYGHGEGPKNYYIMTTKHVVNIGSANDDLVTKPQNKAKLEIVPLANPSALKAGGSLQVQVLFEGKPLKKAELFGDFRGFNPAGSWGLAKAFYCKTDKDGKVDFIPTKGGLWILKVRHGIPNEDKSEAAETVYLSNLSFQVAD